MKVKAVERAIAVSETLRYIGMLLYTLNDDNVEYLYNVIIAIFMP